MDHVARRARHERVLEEHGGYFSTSIFPPDGCHGRCENIAESHTKYRMNATCTRMKRPAPSPYKKLKDWQRKSVLHCHLVFPHNLSFVLCGIHHNFIMPPSKPRQPRLSPQSPGQSSPVASVSRRILLPLPEAVHRDKKQIGNKDKQEDYDPSVPRPMSSQIETLYDLVLQAVLPPMPPIYRRGTLISTKSVTDKEINLPTSDKLRKVVFYKDLVSQVHDRARELLQKLPIRLDCLDDVYLAALIHPYVTSRNQPPVICSEKDVEARYNSEIMDSASILLHIVLKVLYPQHRLANFGPSFTSCPANTPVIPDGRLLMRDKKDVTVTPLVVEIKTPYVMDKMNLRDLIDASPEIQPPAGAASKFDWPTRIGVSNLDNSDDALNEDVASSDTQTKVFVQLWCQLAMLHAEYSSLSSRETTVFLARGRGKNRDTLYISPGYKRDKNPILMTFCWLAISVGLLDVALPDPDDSWWPPSVHGKGYDTGAGLIYQTLPSQHPNSIRAARRTREGPKTRSMTWVT